MRVWSFSSYRFRQWAGFFAAGLAGLSIGGCATALSRNHAVQLNRIAALIDDVKTFGKTLGIEPTEALARTARERPALSMLWLWMQREGTLALSAPIDVRTAIGYSAETRNVKIEQVYRVEGYSVYYRQGNEFADSRSVATVDFSEEPVVRRVKVVLHEDLHGDRNFAQSWEVEEGLVTPLGSLAAVEYFRWKGDEENLRSAVASLNQERQASRECRALAAQAETIFARESVSVAKQRVLALLVDYPAYQKQFERQIRGQHPPTALEAKLSHDLAYCRYFDSIAALAESAASLNTLIADLKTLPANASHAVVEKFLRDLRIRYGAASH